MKPFKKREKRQESLKDKIQKNQSGLPMLEIIHEKKIGLIIAIPQNISLKNPTDQVQIKTRKL